MNLFTKIRCGLVLALPLTAISLFGVLGAQEPRRDQNKKGQLERPTQERPGEPGPNNNGPRDPGKSAMPTIAGNGFSNFNMAPPKPDKELEAWIKILADKMTDRNDNIRNSARKALVSVGPAAMFSLKEMTESKDAATAVAARNVMMEIGRSAMQQNRMMQRGDMRFTAPLGMPGAGGWGKMIPQDMNRKSGQGRDGDKSNRPDVGRPEGDRKAGPGSAPGSAGPGSGGPGRDGDKGNRPEGGRPEGDRKGPSFGPEARDRILKELDLSKEVRAKVEGILTTQQEKMKDIIAKGREGNADREKIMAEVRELQQNMMKKLKESLSEEKFEALMKLAPMLNRGAGPDGSQPGRGGPQGRDATRQKQ